jgi:hypothetical protein
MTRARAKLKAYCGSPTPLHARPYSFESSTPNGAAAEDLLRVGAEYWAAFPVLC